MTKPLCGETCHVINSENLQATVVKFDMAR